MAVKSENKISSVTLSYAQKTDKQVPNVGTINEVLLTKADNTHTHKIEDIEGLDSLGGGGEISDIEGLEDALNSKSDTGHTHTISEIQNLQNTINDLQSQINQVRSYQYFFEGYGVQNDTIPYGTAPQINKGQVIYQGFATDNSTPTSGVVTNEIIDYTFTSEGEELTLNQLTSFTRCNYRKVSVNFTTFPRRLKGSTTFYQYSVPTIKPKCSGTTSEVGRTFTIKVNGSSNIDSQIIEAQPNRMIEIDKNLCNCSHMFSNNYYLNTLDCRNLNTEYCTNMSTMFDSCSNLQEVKLNSSKFNTSKVTNMYQMFYNCRSLTSLDLSNFDTSKVTDMRWMFYNCTSLTSLDLSNFDTSKVTSMGGMFQNCSSLTSLDVSNFDTSNVTDMSGMFNGCKSLRTLNLNNFDFSNTQDFQHMFFLCESLENLYINNWNAPNGSIFNVNMFNNCPSTLKITCKSNFRDWCIANASTIDLPTPLWNASSSQWIII